MYRNSLSLIVLSKKYPLVKPPLYLSYPHLQPMACNSIQISIVLFFMYNTSHLSILFGKHFLIEAVWLVNLFYKPRSNRCRMAFLHVFTVVSRSYTCRTTLISLSFDVYQLPTNKFPDHPTRSFVFSVDHTTALQQSTLNFVCTVTKPT